MISAREIVQNDLKDICQRASNSFQILAGKRLLLTGGAGFLGYYLAQSIAYWNHQNPSNLIEFTLADSFMRGRPAWVEELAEQSSVHILQHDVVKPLPVETGGFDFIIHAASIASPTYYRLHPIETMDANVGGLRALLDFARASDTKLRGFLYFSTSEIYGDPTPEYIPTPEHYRGNVSCTGPRACYDESKRFGETICVNYAQVYKLPIVVARPFNNYGPGLKITDRRVLPDFARDILAGRDIVMLSDGKPSRTFCYIADAVVGYLKILTHGVPGEAYNIGADSPEISMHELALRVINAAQELWGYNGKRVFQVSADKEYLTDNPVRRCPDLTKAKTTLGYSSTIDLDEGLRRTLLWYRENMAEGEL